MRTAVHAVVFLAGLTAASCGPSPAFEPEVPVVVPSMEGSTTGRLRRVGDILLIDLGGSAPLSRKLAAQRASAEQLGETLLVMTTRAQCEPCDGVERSLPDPKMQAALAHVRLVRVDIDAYRQGLEALDVPTDRVPTFFLLSPGLVVTDLIDGGEWDDDVPENIAPVLGAFVRGKYSERREAPGPAEQAPTDL